MLLEPILRPSKDKFVDINTNKDLENIVDFLLSHSTNHSIADIQV